MLTRKSVKNTILKLEIVFKLIFTCEILHLFTYANWFTLIYNVFQDENQADCSADNQITVHDDSYENTDTSIAVDDDSCNSSSNLINQEEREVTGDVSCYFDSSDKPCTSEEASTLLETSECQ